MTHLIEIKTIQCASIRLLFEALKEIITDTNIYFDAKGLKIEELDSSRVALVWVRLRADKFESYVCNVPKLKIGVNVLALWKLLKNMGNKDILTLTVDENNQNILNITIENSEKNFVDRNQYRLLDIKGPPLHIPPKQFDWFIRIPSHDFQDICRCMRDIGKVVEIIDYQRQLTIRCEGDYATRERTIKETKTSASDDDSVSASPPKGLSYQMATQEVYSDQIIRAKFSIKFLLQFTKATNLCPSVELYLANDYPLILRYTIANLGELKFALSPKLDDATE
jgi:proliferating cell nuclear antigen